MTEFLIAVDHDQYKHGVLYTIYAHVTRVCGWNTMYALLYCSFRRRPNAHNLLDYNMLYLNRRRLSRMPFTCVRNEQYRSTL